MNQTTDLLTRRNAALGAGAPLFYEVPLHLVRGDGVYVFDEDGRRYVDMYNNVPCVGHGNPRVVEAMARQQATLNVHSRYLHEGVVAFCRTPCCAARSADRECHSDVQRHGGERGGAADGPLRHGKARHSSAATRPITATASWSGRSIAWASSPVRTARFVPFRFRRHTGRSAGT